MRTATLAARAIRGAGGPRVWACYHRLSAEKNDGKGGSLACERQHAENAEYINRVDPGAVIVCFEDDGYSAFLDIWRPDFEDMMTRMAAGEFDAFIGWHADRLTRQVEVTGRIVRVYEKSGTECHTTLGGHHVNPDALYMQGIISEGESRQKRNRAMSKHKQLGASGGFSGGGRSYGFEPRMEGIRESEAAIIRDMADRLLNGEAATSVVKSLNRPLDQGGILTVTGYREDKETGELVRVPWSISTIKKMLTSPHIIGKREYKGGPQKGGTIVDATWPAILDRPTYEALRALLLDPKRDKRKGRGSNRYLLGGIATCGKCGGKIGGLSLAKSRDAVYRCVSKFDVQRKMEEVDEMVADYVVTRLTEIDMSGTLVSDADSQQMAALVLERDESIPGRRAELSAAFASGALSLADYTAAGNALVEREAAISQAIGHLTATMTRPQRALEGATGPDAARVWDEWSKDTTGAGFARQRAIIALLVDVEILPTTTGRRFDKESVRVTYRDFRAPA